MSLAAEDWFDRPMRWAQLTLVENDPLSFDVGFWLDYIRDIHADAVTLSAGGVVAFYPTRVPFHHRSAWLGNSDPFGELAEGCRRMGLVVVARTDSHAVHHDVFEAHPEWVAAAADGLPRHHASSPEMWVACALGPYSFDFMPQVHHEIMTLYQPDGIFTNRWDGSGICYCAHCRESFRQAHGLELPSGPDAHDPAWIQYIAWRQERLFQIWKLWDDQIRAHNPRARFIPNTGGGALSLLDMKRVGVLADTLFADRQGRHGLMPLWSSGKDAKEYRAALGSKPVVGIFSVGLEAPYRWKDSVQHSAEVRLWVLDGIANGLRPWFTKFSATLHDQRWLKVVRDLYDWHYQNETYLRNLHPLAEAAVVYSQQTAIHYGGKDAETSVEDPLLGIYQALVETRLPFEMLHDGWLDAEHTRPYRLLILPNIACLSDQQCTQLTEYVEQGGSLLATYETSLYDEKGAARENFGLGRLFGARFLGSRQGPMKNSYLRLEWPPQGEDASPLLKGLEGAGRIINGVHWLDVEPSVGMLPPPLTLIPAYPDLPMEKVYPRVESTTIPGVYVRRFGKGKVIYFPWDIDRTYWEVLALDHARLLWNAVDWALDGHRNVRVEGLGVLDVTLWRQAQSITLHLVNLTNPMFMKGPVREIFPVGAQRVTLSIPAGCQVKKVRLLVRGAEVSFEQQGDEISLAVPEIRDHEVVAIDLITAAGATPTTGR